MAAMVVSIAWADNVVNDVAANPGSDTFTAGGSTSVRYQITQAAGGDPQAGCNASDGTPATVTVNVPSGVTVDTDPAAGNQSTLTYTACNAFKSATFASNTAGDYNITVSVTDSGTGTYNINPAAFTLHVLAAADSTPPTLSLPGNITAEATGPTGAVVTYSASASDLVDGPVAVNCSPASGSTFALGATTVNCSATDAHNNTANGSFTVTVQDTTAPGLTLPGNITAEATGPTGAVVTYSASASDLVDGPVAVNCSPASGSTFALGATTVNCSATDAHNNTANGSFTVTVQDTTAPSLTLPGNITAEATGPTGAVVTYSASASDLVDGSVAVTCSPASGSTFAPGPTTVNCSATDAHNNTANGSFTVTVNFNFIGFLQPVDNKILNGMKAGSTAPIKWQVPNGSGGFISDLAIVQTLSSGVIACNATTLDPLEEYATGGTQLRYDATNNQFVYNWQSPRKSGTCYVVRITLTDGIPHEATFQLK